MKNSKTLIIVISVIVAIALVVGAFFAVPWLLIWGGAYLSPDPPKPQVTYGEFPFELVYQINGKIMTISDIYVCEYDGIDIDEGQGKYVKWKSYIKSSKQENLILLKEGDKQVICDIGSAEYYMSYDEYRKTYAEDVIPRLFLIEDLGAVTTHRMLTEEDMNEYKIKIISWELSPPIENIYK